MLIRLARFEGGHEGVGKVVAIGEGVHGIAVGDHVGIQVRKDSPKLDFAYLSALLFYSGLLNNTYSGSTAPVVLVSRATLMIRDVATTLTSLDTPKTVRSSNTQFVGIHVL